MSQPSTHFMTVWFHTGANSHLHHYVLQQDSIQQVGEVQVRVSVRWHECLHLSETDISGLTPPRWFGNL